MTKTHLQSLAQLDLITIAINLRILPSNFLEVRQAPSAWEPPYAIELPKPQLQTSPPTASPSRLLDFDERDDLIDEVYETLTEQRLESLDDLASPLKESLHKFEIEADRANGLVSPLPRDYLADQFGLTKNKLHFILRDMEWAVVFWQLSTDIKSEEESPPPVIPPQPPASMSPSLSITVHESPTPPRFGRQSKLGLFRLGAEGADVASRQPRAAETRVYSFAVSSCEYKRYVFLRNDCNYYWAELYRHQSQHPQRTVLLARSPIIYKPKRLQVESDLAPQPAPSGNLDKSCGAEPPNAWKLFALSNAIPILEGQEPHPPAFPSAEIA